jgi:hypothetical protein
MVFEKRRGFLFLTGSLAVSELSLDMEVCDVFEENARVALLCDPTTWCAAKLCG